MAKTFLKLLIFRRRETPTWTLSLRPVKRDLDSNYNAGKTIILDPWLADHSTRPLTHSQKTRTDAKNVQPLLTYSNAWWTIDAANSPPKY